MLGVGSATTDLDHGYDGDTDFWQDYESPHPKKDEMDKLDKIAVDMGWPKPHIDFATWFDG